MTGWEKVAAATLVAVIGLVALNLAVWRRMRAATAVAADHRGAEGPTESVQQSRNEQE